MLVLPMIAIFGQELRQPSLDRLPEEKTMEQACAKVRSVVVVLGRTDPGLSRYKASLANRGVFGKRVRAWDVRVFREFYVLVDAKSGSILAFHDLKKAEERHDRRNRTLAKYFNTPQEAKARFLRVASQFSIPETWQLDRFEITGDAQSSQPGHGHIGARFKNAQGEICATLALDIQDGMVLDFSRRSY